MIKSAMSCRAPLAPPVTRIVLPLGVKGAASETNGTFGACMMRQERGGAEELLGLGVHAAPKSHLIACAIIRQFPSVRACRREGLACDGDASHVHAHTIVLLQCGMLACNANCEVPTGVASAHTHALCGDVRL